jgi:hypothetical protein
MAEKVSNMITENPKMFIGIFVGITLFVLILLIVSSAVRRAKKKNLLKGNENLVEIIFDETVMRPNPMGSSMQAPGYTLYTVNGDKPEIFGRSIIVPKGNVTIDFEYAFQTVGNNFATSFGRDMFEFTAEAGKKYKMAYNYLEKKMEYKEK